ncbi:hypothetical protein [Xylella fastidiosa]|nr:hypothetical protein [Xylella fastidiosa]UIX81359.1 hypothetical protein LZ756_00145 [Xylella fastidiosa subsp. sandyi]
MSDDSYCFTCSGVGIDHGNVTASSMQLVWPLCVVAVNVPKRGAVIELIGQVDCSNRVALAIGLFESGNAGSFFLDGLGLLPMAEYAIVWFADDVL